MLCFFIFLMLPYEFLGVKTTPPPWRWINGACSFDYNHLIGNYNCLCCFFFISVLWLFYFQHQFLMRIFNYVVWIHLFASIGRFDSPLDINEQILFVASIVEEIFIDKEKKYLIIETILAGKVTN
jgi:hypothetical protein